MKTATRNTLAGIRRDDLRPCDYCGQGVMHGNQIAAYRVEVTQYIADTTAIQQQAGLEMMLGNPFLAHHMGPDAELLKPVSKSDALLCQMCFLGIDVSVAWEAGGKYGTGEATE